MVQPATTFRNAFTAGSSIQSQIEGDLTRILEKATEGSPHNAVALEINVQNALHLIQARWGELLAAGKTSKSRFQNAAFSAVGKFEHEESEQQLWDRVNQLEQHRSDLEVMIAATSTDDALAARVESLTVDILEAKKGLPGLVFDVRFLAARALSDRLEVAPWGVSPAETAENGTGGRNLTNSTLASFSAAIRTFMDLIDSRYGPADWTQDATAEVTLVEDDETRQSRGERQLKWSHEEWLEIINIEYFAPYATAQMKADILNECMAVRCARRGLRKPLDRSAGVYSKQLRSELRGFRAS